jgi:hypothetical protein
MQDQIGLEDRGGRKMTNEEAFGDHLLKDIFYLMGVKPETLEVKVLLQKGRTLESIYVIPTKGTYCNECDARKELKEGETLYKLDIQRVE